MEMWRVPFPDSRKRNLGYEELREATHSTVFQPQRSDGGYNHHSKLVYFRGRYYSMWSNHISAEDGPGQRVLYSSSEDGTNWREPRELAPPPMPQDSNQLPKKWLAPVAWIELDGRLWAKIGAYTSESRSQRTYIFTEIMPSGERGPLMIASPDWIGNSDTDFVLEYFDTEERKKLIKQIREASDRPVPPQGIDSTKLNEFSFYEAADGSFVCLARDDEFSHRMYASISEDPTEWPAAHPTDIPDAPSMTISVALDDGSILLIGNQTATEFDNGDKVKFYDRVPLTVSLSSDGKVFDRAFAVRADKHRLRISGVTGRGEGGGQYPAAIVRDGYLFVLYSMCKEEIHITKIPLRAMGLNENLKEVPPVLRWPHERAKQQR